MVQFFNLEGYSCATPPASTPDGYSAGVSNEHSCGHHDSDYQSADFRISLQELLRLIQFFNLGSYYWCPEMGTLDGFCAGENGLQFRYLPCAMTWQPYPPDGRSAPLK